MSDFGQLVRQLGQNRVNLPRFQLGPKYLRTDLAQYPLSLLARIFTILLFPLQFQKNAATQTRTRPKRRATGLTHRAVSVCPIDQNIPR